MEQAVTVDLSEVGQRLDIWCVGKAPEHSRGDIQRAIRAGTITVNGEAVKAKYEVKAGDTVQLAIPAPESGSNPDQSQAEVVPSIIYEDEHITVVDKPAGVTVHPAQSTSQSTVSDWFAGRYSQAASVGDPGRPGVVHRLDKDTSGVLVLAKTQAAYERLKEQFKRHRVRKEYLALVFGVPGEREGRITRPIGLSPKNPQRRTVIEDGKPAITEWKIEETFGNDYALLRVFPLTGRTHQIRVHLHFLGFPVVGDQFYTFKKQRPPAGTQRQLLHAEKITLQLMDGKRKTFEAPVSEDFATVLESLQP